MQAAALFARGESQAAVARALGVTTAASNHWYQAWQAQGRRGLKAAGRAGRKPRLDRTQWRTIERALPAVFVPLFTGFGAEAIRHRLAASGARAVITEARYRDVVGRGVHEDVPIFVVARDRGRGLRRGDLSLWTEMEAADPAFATVETRADEPCTLMFTSGTTGLPKGCIIPHAMLVGLIPFVDHGLALGAEDLLWATADPGWAFGVLSTGVAPMALGHARLVYEGDFNPRAWCQRPAKQSHPGSPMGSQCGAMTGLWSW